MFVVWSSISSLVRDSIEKKEEQTNKKQQKNYKKYSHTHTHTLRARMPNLRNITEYVYIYELIHPLNDMYICTISGKIN